MRASVGSSRRPWLTRCLRRSTSATRPTTRLPSTTGSWEIPCSLSRPTTRRTLSPRRGAGGAAHEEAFLTRKASRHEEALPVVDAHDLVDDREINGGREKILPDAFDVVRQRFREAAGLDVVVVERPDRIDPDRLQRALAFLEVPGAAADRATRAQPGTEDVDLAAG